MLHVGFDIRPALFDYAGIGRYARELATALTRMPEGEGPYLELFAPSWRGGRRVPPGLEDRRHSMHRGFLPGRVMDRLHKLPGLDAGRWPAKVDVFHWTDYTYPTVRTAAKVMTLHDAAFVVDPKFHGWDTTVLLDRVRRALTHTDMVIVVSAPGRAEAELLGCRPEQIAIVPHGVSPYFRPPQDDSVPREYLLTVGTLEPRKNYMRTLEAMEIAWDKDLAPDWRIVGRVGWDHEAFLKRMDASRHRKRIHWVQHLTDAELLRTYQGAKALIFPSLHEGFGLCVLEAMACGTPVLVGDQTAPAWVAGKASMRVDATQSDAIAAGIERMCSEDAWRKQAAAVGLMRAHEFTWERAAKETMAVYEQAIQRRETTATASV